MKRTLSFLASGVVGVMGVAVPNAEATSSAVFAAMAESSAIQVVGEVPLRADPSIGYALSKMDQAPNVYNKASVIEPGLAGRVALYVYADIIDVPLSSECFYPDPPGPAFKKQSVVQQPTTTPEDQDKSGLGTALCRTDGRPSGYGHAALSEADLDGAIVFKALEATSSTVYRGGLVTAVSESTLRDVTIANLLKISSIYSAVNTVAAATDKATSSTSTIVIDGATVQGQNVAITGAGLVVTKPQPGTSLTDAQKQVNAALEAAGLSVSLLKSSEEKLADGRHGAQAYSGGIEVKYANPEQEKTFIYLLGQSTASAELRGVTAADTANLSEDAKSSDASPVVLMPGMLAADRSVRPEDHVVTHGRRLN